MSDMYDDPDSPRQVEDEQPPRRPGRSRALLITAITLVVLFLGFAGFTSFWTERLWFDSTGYAGVFSTLISTRVVLFAIFGVIMALIVAINIVVAYRLRPIFRPASPEQVNLDRYRDAVAPIRLWLMLGISLLIGAFAGVTAAGRWREYLLWRNGGEFGQKDAYFDRDIGFYVFDLPWLQFMVDFAMGATVVALLATVVVHYLYGGIRLQQNDRFSGAAAAQTSVLLGLFVLAKGADYWLSRFDLLNEPNSLMTGMNYARDHAVLPARNILMFIALICALLFFANVVMRSWLLPSVGLVLLVLSSVLLGMIWPAIVQQFQVNPSQADKEKPYLQANIEATRDAYDIKDVKLESYSGETELSGAEQREALDVAGVRLIDPAVIQPTFEQLQQATKYLSAVSVPDVDRYEIDGTKRDLVVGLREMDQDGMPEDRKNWSNQSTVYTHGYGMIAAYGNQRNAEDEEVPGEDNPIWAEEGLPPKGELTEASKGGYRGEIYFGEKSPNYSIVGKPSEDSPDVELNIPDASEESQRQTTYEGKAGVEVGNTWRQLMYAWKFSEPNIVLSGRVNDKSKILYDRDPRRMVEKVAPWLTVDQDPLPAVVDGKIVWLLDGYTTTDQYPLAQRGSYDTMTSDAVNSNANFRTLPTDEINYMRNAVKATVDAYDGTVTLYEWDKEDPILKAWDKAFPGTVEDREDIPDEIMDHMRYPEDLFKVQRYQLASYHVEDASTFYEGNDRWQVPEDPYKNGQLQAPYRLSVNTGKDGAPVYSLTSVYVPNKKQNLAAFISVDADASDPENYGTLRILRLPSNSQTQGPAQVANTFGSDEGIQDELVPLTRSNAKLVYGNLLTLPVGEGLLYVQPLYTVRDGNGGQGTYPTLQKVLVSWGDKAEVGDTLSEAIGKVLPEVEADNQPETGGDGGSGDGDAGDDGGSGDGDSGDGDSGTNQPEGTPRQQAQELLDRADKAYDAADQALRQGDLDAYQRENKRAARLVTRALQVLGGPAPE